MVNKYILLGLQTLKVETCILHYFLIVLLFIINWWQWCRAKHIICILEYVFQKSWVHMSTFNSDLPPQGSFYFSSFRNPFFLTENSDPWKPQRIYSFAQFCISSKMVSELLCPHCYQKDQYGIRLRFPLSSYSARGWGYIIKYCIRFTFFFICLQCIYLYSLEIQLNSFVLLCFQL